MKFVLLFEMIRERSISATVAEEEGQWVLFRLF